MHAKNAVRSVQYCRSNENTIYNLERVMVDYKQAAEGCSWPIALDDLALIAAIDGEAEPDVMAHLRDCPYCSERAHVFENMQGCSASNFFVCSAQPVKSW